MSIAPEGRSIWGDSDSAGESLRPRLTLADSDGEELAAARLAELLAAAAAAAAAAAMAENRPGGKKLNRVRTANILHAPYTLGPLLRSEGGPRAVTLADEIYRDTRGRGRFATFPREEFTASTEIPSCYRTHSLEILRQTQKEARQNAPT